MSIEPYTFEDTACPMGGEGEALPVSSFFCTPLSVFGSRAGAAQPAVQDPGRACQPGETCATSVGTFVSENMGGPVKSVELGVPTLLVTPLAQNTAVPTNQVYTEGMRLWRSHGRHSPRRPPPRTPRYRRPSWLLRPGFPQLPSPPPQLQLLPLQSPLPRPRPLPPHPAPLPHLPISVQYPASRHASSCQPYGARVPGDTITLSCSYYTNERGHQRTLEGVTNNIAHAVIATRTDTQNRYRRNPAASPPSPSP